MCGIAGLVYKNQSYRAEIGEVKKMTDAIAHRGPDGEDQWVENNIALGIGVFPLLILIIEAIS